MVLAKAKIAATGIILVILACMIAGCSRAPAKSAGEAGCVAVRTAAAVTGPVEAGVSVSGKLEAFLSADIAPKVAGRLASIPVDIGSNVKSGDLLFSLENSELAQAVYQAEAAHASAQVAFEVARVNYERGRRLLAEGAISQADFDTKFELPYKTGMQQVAQASAALNMARANLNNTYVTAPFSGVVTNRKANPGELASPQVPVISLADVSRVVVRSNVSEELVNCFREGQKVRVRVPAAGGAVFEGTVTNVSLAAEGSSKAYPVKIQIDNRDLLLKPGMYAEVLIDIVPEKGALVPQKAVHAGKGGENYVFVVRDGVARKVAVSVGKNLGGYAEIISGLESGCEVVVESSGELRDGASVYVLTD